MLTLNKEKFQDIYMDGFLIILLFFRFFNINNQIFFIASAVYLLYLIIVKGKIMFPKISGFKLYLVSIAFSALFGFFLFPIRNTIRDLSYFAPTIVWVFIGTQLASRSKAENKSLLKILYIFGVMNSLRCFAAFFIHPSTEFNEIRIMFSNCVYDVAFIMPIFLYESVLCKKIAFSNRIDKIMIILMAIQVIFSLGRAQMLQVIIMLAVIIATLVFSKRNTSTLLKQIIAISIVAVIAILITASLFPDSVLAFFFEKVANTFSEIDAQNTYNSTADVMDDWRGYEIQASIKQFKASGLFHQIFGDGMGSGVRIAYIPYTWKFIENNLLPITHNGFITMLSKCGIVGFISLCMIFAGTIITGFKKIRENEHFDEWLIIVAMNMSAIAFTYVVCGPIAQNSGTFFVWALLMGWIIKSISIKKEII